MNRNKITSYINILRNANLGGVLREAADAGIEALERVRIPPNEWVSVEERLPVEAKKVLCVLELSGGPMVETGYYMGDEGWYYTGIEAPHHGIVTHWIPLPTPPKSRPPEGEEETT